MIPPDLLLFFFDGCLVVERFRAERGGVDIVWVILSSLGNITTKL